MPRFAANISMQFTELPFVERFAAAAHAGFDAVEFSYTDEVSIELIQASLRQHGLQQVLATLPGSPQDKGLAATPGAESQFIERLQRGLSAAAATKCPVIHVTTGVISDAQLLQASSTFMANMKLATAMAECEGITMVIEAINQVSLPHYFIRSLEDAMTWVDRLAHPSLRVLVDFYHAHVSGVDLDKTLCAVKSHGGHVQIAGAPGRAEPDTGQIDYRYVFEALDAMAYPGWVGCEYQPASGTEAGLKWRKSLVSHPTPIQLIRSSERP